MALILTDDGSHSYISPQFGVLYHSKHGAIQETECVFINAGLRFVLNQHLPVINILEIGFGTGLNALMTFIEAQKLDVTINFVTTEAYPLSIEASEQLNFPSLLNNESSREILQLMHTSDWDTTVSLSSNFTFHKKLIDFKEIDFKNQFNLIYFDAFAPESQPELWSSEVFQKMYDALLPDGVLTTYCAKGVVKRTLKSVGFYLESLPGPPGKREMTRVIKKQ